MTKEQKAFLKAIKAAPKDDLTRKVYADWLDENGQPEEAARQRKYVTALLYLEDLAAKHRAQWGRVRNIAIEGQRRHVGNRQRTADAINDTIYNKLFWEYLEIITGQTFDAAHRERAWVSCAC